MIVMVKEVYEIQEEDGTVFGIVREEDKEMSDGSPVEHFYILCGCGGKQHILCDSEESYEHTFI